MKRIILAAAFFCAFPAFAQLETYELKLKDAEARAIETSNQLKSFGSDADAVGEQANSQYATLFPRLSLEGTFQYESVIPSFTVSPVAPPIQFGSNTSYSVGPVLRYTLWDTGANRKAYHGLLKLAESRREDEKSASLQLLYGVRAAYVQVQLGIEELRLINSSLELARAEDHDVSTRFRAGAAARLDLVTSHRSVLNYELQFAQRQAELSASLKDLLAYLNDTTPRDITHPGPPNVEQVTLVLNLDPLSKLLDEEGRSEIPPPDDSQPQIRSQVLLAESSEQSAASQRATLYPTLQLLAKTSLDYPNGPVLQRINQNIVGVSLAMPLFEADRTRHLVAQQEKEADAARYRENQVRIDLQRDFAKARELLDSLLEQQRLARQDVQASEEAAKLNFDSYRAGKINFTDVQTANNQALIAKVNAARIDAQVLNQIITLKAISGKEPSHE